MRFCLLHRSPPFRGLPKMDKPARQRQEVVEAVHTQRSLAVEPNRSPSAEADKSLGVQVVAGTRRTAEQWSEERRTEPAVLPVLRALQAQPAEPARAARRSTTTRPWFAHNTPSPVNYRPRWRTAAGMGR